jgi:hypothetical protein
VLDAIADSNYTSANSTNNSIMPNNIVEQNQQNVNGLILKRLLYIGYTYTTADIISLNSIAYQCPIAGGTAVYQARNMLMVLADHVIEFTDTCDDVSNNPIVIKNKHSDKENEEFKIYPNPNNGTMTLQYHINQADIAVIQLFDISGKKVETHTMNTNTDKLQINNDQLKNGIYFYQIVVNNKIVKHDKLIIIK